MGMRGMMGFDAAAFKTISGKVVSYRTADGFGPQGMKALIIDTGKDKITLMLGPDSYIDSLKLALKAGEPVSATAISMHGGTKNFYMAKSITAGGKTVNLRDTAGFPAWHGKGPGRGTFGMGPGMMGPGHGPANMIPPSVR